MWCRTCSLTSSGIPLNWKVRECEGRSWFQGRSGKSLGYFLENLLTVRECRCTFSGLKCDLCLVIYVRVHSGKQMVTYTFSLANKWWWKGASVLRRSADWKLPINESRRGISPNVVGEFHFLTLVGTLFMLLYNGLYNLPPSGGYSFTLVSLFVSRISRFVHC